MQIDHCLIMSAGFGTRMGLIGETLPKILWPIFEKTLLELQIEYAKSLGCKHIYVNSHFLYQKIFQSFQKIQKKNATLVHEPTLLGSGGSVHNIACLHEVQKKGILLVMNGDQFFFPTEQSIFLAMDKIQNSPAVLFSVEVEGKYAEVLTRENLLVGINEPSSKKKCMTYSGMGLVNLEKLNLVSGVSNFFTTVADFKNNKIPMIFGQSDYWDFGTIERYYNSMFNLLDKVITERKSPFVDFFLKNKGMIKKKINYNKKSYNHNQVGVINLSSCHVKNPEDCRAIVLSLKKTLNIKTSGIYYDNLVEEIS